MNERNTLKQKKRIVIKVGSSSLLHTESGRLDFAKLEVLIRELADLRNSGRDIVLVSSGAIAVGRAVMGLDEVRTLPEKQAFASVGQARLMMIYQKLFAEYGQNAAQILLTKNTIDEERSRINARNTFDELFQLRAIPVVNENDTIATDEIEFGDNDMLSAYVARLISADLLILLSDIDGLYTDDPHRNADAEFIPEVRTIDDELIRMAKETTGSVVGTGGMSSKLEAAKMATAHGTDLIIASAEDFHNIHRIMRGDPIGTLFPAKDAQ